MNKTRIYLSGAMTGVDEGASKGWRKTMKETFYSAVCFDPWDYWDFDMDVNEHEAMNFDLNMLRKSDLVIVNFEMNPKSIGTNMELAVAHELRIPVIGFCRHGELHPWQKNICERIFTNWDEMLAYVKLFYLEEL